MQLKHTKDIKKMGVKVKKSVFEQLIKKFVNEHNNSRTPHSTRIDQIAGEELPVLPNAHMPLQLSTEMPNVADEEYMPTTPSALSDAAATIAQEVPDNQVEFFYNQMHNLLKNVMDREEEARIPVMEVLLFEAMDDIMREIAETGPTDAELDAIEDEAGTAWIDDQAAIDDEDFLSQDEQPELKKIDNYDKENADEIVKALAKLLVDRNWNMTAMLTDDGESYVMKHDKSNKQYMAKLASNDNDRKYVDSDNIAMVPAESNSVISAKIGPQQIKEMLLYAFINDNDVKRLILDFYKLTKPKKVAKVMSTGFMAHKLDQRELTDLAVVFLDLSELLLKEPGFSDPAQEAEEAEIRKTDAELGVIMRKGVKAAYSFKREIDEKNKSLPKAERTETLRSELADELNNTNHDMPQESVDAYNEQLQAFIDATDEQETNVVDDDDEAIEGLFDVDKAEKRLETNLENQSDLFGFSGANGIRQWFQKHPEQKFMTLVRGASDMGGEKMHKQTFSALEALIMSPGVEKWFKKIRKKTPKGLKPDAVEKVIAGIEAIINDVTTGDEEIDFDKLTKTSAGWIIRGAFDKLVLSKTFGTFYNNRLDFGEKEVANLDITTKQKTAIASILAGIAKKPVFDKEGTPQNGPAKKILVAGITIEEFEVMQKSMDKKIKAYFDDNITDIKNYYNKRLQDEGAITSAFDKAVADIRDNVEEMTAAKNIENTLASDKAEDSE